MALDPVQDVLLEEVFPYHLCQFPFGLLQQQLVFELEERLRTQVDVSQSGHFSISPPIAIEIEHGSG